MPGKFEIRPAAIADLPACERILRSLPDWFGIEEAIDHYAADMKHMTTLVARAGGHGGEIVGFLTLNAHSDVTVEIHVMAVREEWHRRGVGRSLMRAAEAWARDRSYRLLEVKTLGPSHPDENYRRTRAFYTAACPLRTRLSSSRKATSKTQCSRFSIPQ